MALKTESELTAPQRDTVNRARSALSARNYDYAITLLLGLVKSEPLFLEGRRLLRASAIQKYKSLSGFARQMTGVKIAGLVLKASAGKREPLEAMSLAEDILAVDPYNRKGNELVGEAGVALEELEITAMAYETYKEGNPKDKKNLMHLGDLYMKMGEFPRAEQTYSAILEFDPRDGEAVHGMKNASAANASRSGGWDSASDYRDLIKDKEEAKRLEQANRVVKSDVAIDDLIAQAYEKVQAEPSNLNHPKRIAQLCEQKEDFASAIQWYTYTYEAGGRTDNSLEKKIDDLKMTVLDHKFEALKEAAATDPAVAQQLAEIEKERSLVLLDTAKRRVEKYPNDYQYHFELGEAYYNAGQYREALPELQLGTKQPNVRSQAQNLIGMCYLQRGMYDLGEKVLRDSKAELPVMDGPKKEITYNLALLLEKMGKKEEYIAELKEIYEVDMGFRDVAHRVEASYGH
jgi:tetratricopeptide (TPR) repeat protein